MKHGTYYGGFRKRCKCDECRLFRNSYMRNYRARIKAGHVPQPRNSSEIYPDRDYGATVSSGSYVSSGKS